MQHLKPMSKGDPLCPLGFHPQVRWPSRCKRCFRDHKEHGNRNKDLSLRRDETTLSSPSLSAWAPPATRSRDETVNSVNRVGSRAWTSSSNLSAPQSISSSSTVDSSKPESSSAASSWTSTPDLANLREDTRANTTTVSLTLPRRRSQQVVTEQDNDDHRRTAYTVRRRTTNSILNESSSGRPDSKPTTLTAISLIAQPKDRTRVSAISNKSNKDDVDFMLHVKSSVKPPTGSGGHNLIAETKATSSPSDESSDSGEEKEEDNVSLAGTETTDTTIVNDNELQDQIESLKQELEATKLRCERVEREKSDILLRRLACRDPAPSKTTALEVLKLQQRVNDLQSNMEDLRDDKRSLSLRVCELEAELERSKVGQSVQKEVEQLRGKLAAAEALCEELMEENQEMKKELREMEEEIDEMQDNFREDQADEYSSLKKELDQTAKNCRILSFKLRKAERKVDTLEAEKLDAEKKCREVAGGQAGLDKAERIRHLEQELTLAKEAAHRLQKELDEANAKLKSSGDEALLQVGKKKTPMLGSIPKTPSAEKVSRESLTRGGSQEDPVQLLRDLQDSLEREADLREQLRYAEEEAQNFRKKASRVEDDNESLVLQLKKMATKARTRRQSPTPSRLTPELAIEKDEGISDDEDPGELRILLELNEQEAAVLRRKVEELEGDGDNLKKKVKQLQEKLIAKSAVASKKALQQTAEPGTTSAIYKQKLKVLEEEMGELRKKLNEKEHDCERLQAELALIQKRPKLLQKSKSLDGSGDQQAIDLKQQLQVVEQEASVLSSRNQALEADNEKLATENKHLVMSRGSKKTTAADSTSIHEKIKNLENQLLEANSKVKNAESTGMKNAASIKNMTGKDTGITSAEIDQLKSQLMKTESEKVKLSECLKRLKEDALIDAVEFYRKRTPKKPTDVTSKVQLKKMAEDLESEMSEVLIILNKMENDRKKVIEEHNKDTEKANLKIELEQLKTKLASSDKDLIEEKSKKRKETDKLMKEIKSLQEGRVRIESEMKKLKESCQAERKTMEDKIKVQDAEKEKLLVHVEKLNKEINSALAAKDEISMFKQRVDTLNSEIMEEKRQSDALRRQIEGSHISEADKLKASKEHAEAMQKLTEAEKRMKEIDDKLKKSEKLVAAKKDRISKLEIEIGESKDKVQNMEKSKKELSETWESEKVALKIRIEELEANSKRLQTEMSSKSALVDQLEKSVREERERATNLSIKAGSAASREVIQLRDELGAAKKSAIELQTRLNKGERKMMDKLKVAHEKELKNKEQELATLRAKLQQGAGKKLADLKLEYESKVERLQLALESEKHEYDELTNKYEELEEEHVGTKAQLNKDKEAVKGQLISSQRELTSVEFELRTLRETYNNKQDSWIKEKLSMQERIKELDGKAAAHSLNKKAVQVECAKLQAMCNERSSQLDTLRNENKGLTKKLDRLKKENEETISKLDDYEKLSQIQHNISDTSALEKDLRETTNKLVMEERARRMDLSSLKLRYDNRVSVITAELASVQKQVSRFKKERDIYRHMMEAAQKTITELKASGVPHGKQYQSEEVEEMRSQVVSLEQQVSCMEDELSEARLEGSRLKTELVSEKSAWEVKLSEMVSRINELEEDRILNSGRTKIAGLQTRMELSWQKEREDQHRLLQETSTLARDLRQTLFEVERERDKERMESKRRHDQLKKTTEEEQEENRRKLTELQCDLLELRDAHAKLRTTNEKLRREKDRVEREREAIRQATLSKRRKEQEEDHKLSTLLQLVDELIVLAPELFPSKTGVTIAIPTPPVRRKGSKSRESSPALEKRDVSREPSVSREENKSQQLYVVTQQLTEATEELKKVQRLGDEEAERTVRARKLFANRRAASTESENPDMPLPLGTSRGLQRKGSLYRKSLSLEQTSPSAVQQAIWKTEEDETEGSINSIQSLDDSIDSKFHSLQRRDPSLDSRLSGGSTQSEVLHSSDKKKKIGLFGKLKQMTRSSKSMDRETSEIGSSAQLDPGSDSSITSAFIERDSRSSKRDIKERLTGIFKKSGSTSRGNSLERNISPPQSAVSDQVVSTQRPLVRNSSSGTLNRMSPSPARSDSSSISRPLGAISNKKPPTIVPVQHKAAK